KVLGSVHTLPFLAPARFARAIAVDNAALRQIVRREFDVHAIARKNFDVMAAQTAGDVRENDVSVVEFDRKGRAGKHLFDASVDLQWRFFEVFGRVGFRSPGIIVFAAVASSDTVSPIFSY